MKSGCLPRYFMVFSQRLAFAPLYYLPFTFPDFARDVLAGGYVG